MASPLVRRLIHHLVRWRARVPRGRSAEPPVSRAAVERAYWEVLRALATAVDAKNPCTQGHSARVGLLAVALAAAMGLPPDRIARIERAALLHDVGKIGVDDAILMKTEPLDAAERAAVSAHPVIGAQMLRGIESLAPLVPGVLHHHERYDGAGYPRGLAGTDIPLDARIIVVADAYDAMRSDRPYRAARSPLAALHELQRCRGTHFDPAVVDAAVHCAGRLEDLCYGPVGDATARAFQAVAAAREGDRT